MSEFFNHLRKDRINYWKIDFGLPTEQEILFPGTVILLSHLKKSQYSVGISKLNIPSVFKTLSLNWVENTIVIRCKVAKDKRINECKYFLFNN